MSQFDRAFVDLLGHEGAYSNDPDDPGGETMWGVTVAVARASGYNGPMRDMPQSTAMAIYSTQYWKGWMNSLDYALAFQVFDASVNSGPVQAIKWLQRSLGIKDDGLAGPQTLAAAQAADPVKTAVLFNVARLEFMTDLKTWPSFGKGRATGN
jgi:lysozyme family protein